MSTRYVALSATSGCVVIAARQRLTAVTGDNISRVPCTKVLSQSTSGFGFFLYHSKDLDEPDKPGTSVFLISQHMKSYKPSKKMELSAPRPLFCVHKGSIVQRFSIEPLCRR